MHGKVVITLRPSGNGTNVRVQIFRDERDERPVWSERKFDVPFPGGPEWSLPHSHGLMNAIATEVGSWLF